MNGESLRSENKSTTLAVGRGSAANTGQADANPSAGISTSMTWILAMMVYYLH